MILLAAVAAITLGQNITTDFTADAEGWSAVNCNCGGNYAPVLSANPFVWLNGPGADGSPGFLQASDPFSQCIFFNAPAAYTGNQSLYQDGLLTFWVRCNTNSWVHDDVVVMVSNGAPVLVRPVGVPTTLNTWVSYSVPLSADGAWRVGNKAGPPATALQFSAALASLTALRLPAEFGANAPEERTDLDSVKLLRRCGQADMGSQGGVIGPDGVLNNNDFIVFIDLFFQGSPAADLGQQGGVPLADGLLNNNDFIVFIDLFFQGC